MGWASYLEDCIERIQAGIHTAEQSLSNTPRVTSDHRNIAVKALKDAQAILTEAWNHLEIATAPELDHARELVTLRSTCRSLQLDLVAAKKDANERAIISQRLANAKREIGGLRKEKRKLEKKLEKLLAKDFGAAVELYSTPGMFEKHKPNQGNGEK